MTKENHSKGTQILEQIDKLESLSKKIGVEYRKSTDNDLKELLNKCDEAVNVLKEINQDKFKALYMIAEYIPPECCSAWNITFPRYTQAGIKDS